MSQPWTTTNPLREEEEGGEEGQTVLTGVRWASCPSLIEFQDLLMLLRQQSKSLNTQKRVFKPRHQRQLWLCSYTAAEGVPKSAALSPLPNLILLRPHVEQNV